MLVIPSLISGLTVGVEVMFPTENDPSGLAIIHFFIFRILFIWGSAE